MSLVHRSAPFLFGFSTKAYLNVSHRQIALSLPTMKKWKWLSKDEAAKTQHEMTIGFRHGHKEDPEYWPPNRIYTHSPEMGDKPLPEFAYREQAHKQPQSYLDRTIHKILASMFVGWVAYNLYYNNGMLIGHGYSPKPKEFTDEELGIPPDDAPDPDYWGLHGKPSGTTRYW